MAISPVMRELSGELIHEWGRKFFPHFTPQFQVLAIVTLLRAHLGRNR